MTRVLKAVMPAAYLTVFLVVALFVVAFARSGVAAALNTNGLLIGIVPITVVGWWAGVLARRSKGTLADTFTAGLAVGLLHGVLAIVLFGYVAAGSLGPLLDLAILGTLLSIVGAVAGAGITGGK